MKAKYLIDRCGGKLRTCEKTGISRMTLNQWLKGDGLIPVRYAVFIHFASSGAIPFDEDDYPDYNWDRWLDI